MGDSTFGAVDDEAPSLFAAEEKKLPPPPCFACGTRGDDHKPKDEECQARVAFARFTRESFASLRWD